MNWSEWSLDEIAKDLAIIAASTPNHSGYYDLLVLLLGNPRLHFYSEAEQAQCEFNVCKQHMKCINAFINEYIGHNNNKIYYEVILDLYQTVLEICD